MFLIFLTLRLIKQSNTHTHTHTHTPCPSSTEISVHLTPSWWNSLETQPSGNISILLPPRLLWLLSVNVCTRVWKHLRWVLLNNLSCLRAMHRLHIVILCHLLALGMWKHEQVFVFWRDFFFESRSQERKEVGGGRSLRNREKQQENREQHLFPFVPGTRSQNFKGKPIAGPAKYANQYKK